MRRALFLALLLSLAPCGLAAQAFDVGPRFVRFSAPVEAVTHRVRIGQNHGNAMALAGRVESGVFRGTIWYSGTQVVTDTASGDNPGAGAHYEDVELIGLTVGLGHRVGQLGIAGGAGGLALTCSFASCGSSPMFGWLVGADVDLCIGSGIRACIRAGLEAVPPREGRWTWLADRAYAGREDDPSEVHGGSWFTMAHLGLSVGLRL